MLSVEMQLQQKQNQFFELFYYLFLSLMSHILVTFFYLNVRVSSSTRPDESAAQMELIFEPAVFAQYDDFKEGKKAIYIFLY